MFFIIIPTIEHVTSIKFILKLLRSRFGVLKPSSGSLQLCQLKLWIIELMIYNTDRVN